MNEFFIIDAEGNGLHADKIYVMSVHHKDQIFSTNNYEDMKRLLTRDDITIIGHNIIRWDIPTFERVLGIKVKARLVDTLAISYYLYPNKNRHGLKEWGIELGISKPEVEDWHNLSYKVYKHRCEEDVKITKALWVKFYLYLDRIYGDQDKIWKLISYLTFKFKSINYQEMNKWKVDKGYVIQKLKELEAERQPKLETLAKAMPPVPVYKTKTYPTKLYKKDGSRTAQYENYLQLLSSEGYKEDFCGDIKYIHSYIEPNPQSTSQLKDWLFSLGWEPDLYKDDVPQINQERGKGLTPSVLALAEKEPAINELSDLSILNHRIPFLEGLLRSLDNSNYTVASFSGFTNTLRLKHKILVNLPKAEAKYAEGIRGSLICEDDELLFGSDQSSLEDRIKQHYMYEFDPDTVEEMNEEGYDPHLKLAVQGGAVTEDQVQKYKDGVDKSIKPIRDVFKNGNYACQYGAFPPKIAQTCKVDLETATKIFNAYWEVNKSIKQVVACQKIKEVNGQLWLLNPINGFYYFLKKEKDVFSTLVQGTASYVFDVWLGFVLSENTNVIGQFHDEFILRDKEANKDNVIKLIRNANDNLNNLLKLNRKLDIDVQTGKRYSDIH